MKEVTARTLAVRWVAVAEMAIPAALALAVGNAVVFILGWPLLMLFTALVLYAERNHKEWL